MKSHTLTGAYRIVRRGKSLDRIIVHQVCDMARSCIRIYLSHKNAICKCERWVIRSPTWPVRPHVGMKPAKKPRTPAKITDPFMPLRYFGNGGGSPTAMNNMSFRSFQTGNLPANSKVISLHQPSIQTIIKEPYAQTASHSTRNTS